MVGTRKTSSGRSAINLDGSPNLEGIDDEDGTDITDQFPVGSLALLVFPLVDSSGPKQFNAALLGQHLC